MIGEKKSSIEKLDLNASELYAEKTFDNKLGQVRLVRAVQSELCSADRQTKD